jgi:hypothetical protein
LSSLIVIKSKRSGLVVVELEKERQVHKQVFDAFLELLTVHRLSSGQVSFNVLYITFSF